MDTPAEQKAVKKHHLREKCAAANSPTPVTIPDMNPPTIIAPNASDTTTTVMDNSACPNKDIEDLWRLVAQRAAKKAWQCNYIEEQMRLKAAAMQSTYKDIVPTPLSQPSHLPAPNSTENYFHKQQLCTAPIAVNMIIEPLVPTSSALRITNDDNTVKKVDPKLLRMEQYWAPFRSGPFPEGIQNSVAELRAVVEKEEAEAAQVAALLSVQSEESEKREEEKQSEEMSETSMKEKSEREEEDKIEGRIEEKKQNENVANDGTTRQKSMAFDWAADVDASVGICPIVADNDVPDVSTIPALAELDNPILAAPDNPVPATLHDPTPTVHVDADVASVPISLINTISKMFVDPVMLGESTPITYIKPVVDPAPVSSAKSTPIVPVSPILLIAHSPRDFSDLWSNARNPWGSIHHR